MTKIETSKRIQEAIKSRTLFRNPELFPTVLDILKLKDFWKSLTGNTDKYVVFQQLAIERMLNFYEASLCSDMTHGMARQGLVICALLSTAVVDKKYRYTSMIHSPWGVLTARGVCDLSDFKLLGLNPVDKEEIEKLVKIFAAGKPTSQKMNCSMVGEYASNICRMWILSDNPDVLSFMTQREFRLAVFSGDQPGIESLRAAVQYTHFSNYDYVDLSIFSVPWARNKGVMFNTPGAYARLKKLVEEASS